MNVNSKNHQWVEIITLTLTTAEDKYEDSFTATFTTIYLTPAHLHWSHEDKNYCEAFTAKFKKKKNGRHTGIYIIFMKATK